MRNWSVVLLTSLMLIALGTGELVAQWTTAAPQPRANKRCNSGYECLSEDQECLLVSGSTFHICDMTASETCTYFNPACLYLHEMTAELCGYAWSCN